MRVRSSPSMYMSLKWIIIGITDSSRYDLCLTCDTLWPSVCWCHSVVDNHWRINYLIDNGSSPKRHVPRVIATKRMIEGFDELGILKQTPQNKRLLWWIRMSSIYATQSDPVVNRQGQIFPFNIRFYNWP